MLPKNPLTSLVCCWMIYGWGVWLFSPVGNVATRPGPILGVLPELQTGILSWGSVATWFGAKLNNFPKYFWTGASFPYGNSRAPVPYLTRLNWFWELYANFAVRSVVKTLCPLGVLTRWLLAGSPGCFFFQWKNVATRPGPVSGVFSTNQNSIGDILMDSPGPLALNPGQSGSLSLFQAFALLKQTVIISGAIPKNISGLFWKARWRVGRTDERFNICATFLVCTSFI